MKQNIIYNDIKNENNDECSQNNNNSINKVFEISKRKNQEEINSIKKKYFLN